MSPVERSAGRTFVVASARVAAVLLAVAGTVGAVVGGGRGAASALAGAGLVGLLSVSSAAGLAWATPRGPGAALVTMVGGVALRLVVYAAALAGLARQPWVQWPSLAGATVIALVVGLSHEARHIARNPRLSWVQPDAGRTATSTSPVDTTRSSSL
jgi:hypothetical protein